MIREMSMSFEAMVSVADVETLKVIVEKMRNKICDEYVGDHLGAIVDRFIELSEVKNEL